MRWPNADELSQGKPFGLVDGDPVPVLAAVGRYQAAPCLDDRARGRALRHLPG